MPPTNRKSERPQIWAEGRQTPPFSARAFALASVLYARDSLSRLLQRCAASAAEFGQVMATGRWRVPAHRLGRLGRLLPSVEATAKAIAAGSTVLSRAAVSVADAPPAAPVSIFTPTVEKPAPARPAPPRAAAEDPELAAIRAVIEEAAAHPPAPRRPSRPVAVQAAPAATGWRQEWLADKAGAVLGYGLLIVAVPVGAVQAALAHLNGEDLRALVDQR